ncbi:longitudinals lacking protein, isoforms A/B/D/L-like [Monomorium pharaonis]|uniref:longitudinals lacking protein, isoforms A/B/D/L-like n=1 Tax=Monomorium pharaonis TaxID=307658 RepID=UPI001746269C|nr:longitudinals lacking protein, isoforms A/B/D/L-like [Monomorium pharaonis]
MMLTVTRSFVGGRSMELHDTRRKKYIKKRDTGYNSDTGKFHCPNCNNGYGRRDTMLGHFRYECGKAPRYKCPYCNLCSKKTSNVYQHVRCMHPKERVSLVRLY